MAVWMASLLSGYVCLDAADELRDSLPPFSSLKRKCQRRMNMMMDIVLFSCVFHVCHAAGHVVDYIAEIVLAIITTMLLYFRIASCGFPSRSSVR